MKKFWKQSAASAIGSKRNLFRAARFKLTGFYILTMAIIMIVFSGIVYYAVAANINDNVEGNFQDEASQQIFVTKTLDGLKNELILVDLGVLAAVSALSYFAAGRTLRPIKNALEAQQRFSGDAAHELLTPLTVIRSEAEVALENKAILSESRKSITNIVEEVDDMTQMVEDLLTLSRSGNMSAIPTSSRIDMSELILAVAQKMTPLAAQKNISISIDELVEGAVLGNGNDLRRAVRNIIQNAIKYTPQGGGVTIAFQNDGRFITSVIEDNGMGIASEDIKHIFEPFYRADKARPHGGAGLGLSIVKRIVEQHGGSVDIKSNFGKGTTVNISLPLASA
jgi:signal transduction histidine kinase